MTEQNKDNQRPDAVPASLSDGAVEPKYKKGDHVWANQPLTEQAAYDEYQERSKTSGDRAEQLAWAMIVLLAGQLIGGSKYAEFYVLGGAALLYLLLSAMQSVWQSVAFWIIKCRIKRTGVTLNDYPNWVGFGAWVLYWLKTIIIALGAIYGAYRFSWSLF